MRAGAMALSLTSRGCAPAELNFYRWSSSNLSHRWVFRKMASGEFIFSPSGSRDLPVTPGRKPLTYLSEVTAFTMATASPLVSTGRLNAHVSAKGQVKNVLSPTCLLSRTLWKFKSHECVYFLKTRWTIQHPFSCWEEKLLVFFKTLDNQSPWDRSISHRNVSYQPWQFRAILVLTLCQCCVTVPTIPPGFFLPLSFFLFMLSPPRLNSLPPLFLNKYPHFSALCPVISSYPSLHSACL